MISVLFRYFLLIYFLVLISLFMRENTPLTNSSSLDHDTMDIIPETVNTPRFSFI